ncbi:MAG: DEAD/DEAH box helicase [Bacteroidota bacterium]
MNQFIKHPNSSVPLCMLFSDLNLSSSLLRGLADAGLEVATPIQERAFSPIMSGRDVVGIAQTGTGKTIAYLLPTLRLWKFRKDRFPQVLVLVPTRELVVQVVEEIEKLTPYMNVVPVGVYGGTNMNTQKDLIDQGLDVLVGTPGRVLDLALHGSLKFKAIQRLIIDEVDEMLELGFRPQLTRIFDLLPEKRQNLLFSATMVPEVEAIIEEFFNGPEYIQAAASGTPLENINQLGYQVANFNTKVNLLSYLLADKETYQKTLVFTPGKRLADVVYERLIHDFPDEVAIIHGNKSQNFRFNSLRSFQAGEQRILIATDLVSRGLDISDISHVINIDTPEIPEDYIHRIGRTGRADKHGVAITFTTEDELPSLEAAEALMQHDVKILPFPADVVVSNQLIPEEMPQLKVKNVRVKLDTTEAGAFHEKQNKKTQLNRFEIREQRRRPKGKKKKKGKWKK